jgi:radical SAM protein with 4Fe4S-binding SPASM domain
MNLRLVILRSAASHPLLWRIFERTIEGVRNTKNRLQINPPLRAVAVEVTNNCNLSCIMCSNDRMERERGFMSRDVCDLLARQIPDNSLRLMCMLAVGEPSLHPDLVSLLQTVRGKAGRLMLCTNVVALKGNHELAERIMTSGLNHLHISADGYDSESYEKIRQGARFRDLLTNMEILKKARDRHNPALMIELQYCLVRKHSLEELARVFEVFDPYVDLVAFKPLNNQAHESIAYRPQEKILGINAFKANPVPCVLLWNSPTVLWDGKVSACSRDYDGSFVMGDLQKQSLLAIWHCTAMRNLRKDHLNHRFPRKCKNCSQLLESTFQTIKINKHIRQKLDLPWRGLIH